MTNLDAHPAELICRRTEHGEPQLIDPRDVPLGGIRAMRVRRTLPTRGRSFIGHWCFVDHYGPDNVARTGGMDVAPHPHIGLQTVSWLFEGEIEHRDSLGTHAMVLPGELNVMTAGRGIAHSEVSTAATTILHGVQLWVALPADKRQIDRAFDHYATPQRTDGGLGLRVFLGDVGGEYSPVRTHSPLVGAEITLADGHVIDLPLDPDFEHGLLIDTGIVEVDGATPAAKSGQLAALPRGRTAVQLRPLGGPARLMLIGGTPMESDLVMWWNFVGGSHEEIVAARADWQQEIGRAEIGTPIDDVSSGAASPRFGAVDGYGGDPLPAPQLPGGTLRPRRPSR